MTYPEILQLFIVTFKVLKLNLKTLKRKVEV